jgi:hypothetical protein
MCLKLRPVLILQDFPDEPISPEVPRTRLPPRQGRIRKAFKRLRLLEAKFTLAKVAVKMAMTEFPCLL